MNAVVRVEINLIRDNRVVSCGGSLNDNADAVVISDRIRNTLVSGGVCCVEPNSYPRYAGKPNPGITLVDRVPFNTRFA